MSYFDDASLVMIPSGYKTSKVYSVKPTDGTGDLAFTRSNDTATRVNSAGLIEKVRTNLVLYSEQFDNAAWTALQATVSANATTSPIGTTTADKVIPTAVSSFHNVTNSPFLSTGVSYSISVYAKADGYSSVAVGNGFGTRQALFNLTTGVVTSVTSDTTASIVNAGNGWFRCSIAFIATNTTNQLQITVDDGSGSTFVGNGTSGIFLWGAQAETGDIATPYIATTTAAVSVGPVANVPRLDYLNSSCPRLLLEPQRINLVTFSEQINNADWFSNNLTITANQAISPDGYTNADLLDDGTAASTQHWFYQGTTLANSTTYTLSLYAKYVSRQNMSINIYNGASSQYVDYNIQNGTIVGSTGDVTASITSAGNGWYRLTYTRAMAASGGPNYRIALADDTGNETYTGSNKQTLIYGCQIEAGAYATSYIPTLGASVTRSADAASKTGISSLIGQTEGTIFVEGSIIGDDSVKDNLFAALEKTSSGATMRIFNSATTNVIIGDVYTGSGFSAQMSGPAIPVGQTFKAALAYKENDFVLAVNGVIVATDNSGVVPTTDDFKINTSTYANLDAGIRQAQTILFKTRLTNAQLAELTTI